MLKRTQLLVNPKLKKKIPIMNQNRLKDFFIFQSINTFRIRSKIKWKCFWRFEPSLTKAIVPREQWVVFYLQKKRLLHECTYPKTQKRLIDVAICYFNYFSKRFSSPQRLLRCTSSPRRAIYSIQRVTAPSNGQAAPLTPPETVTMNWTIEMEKLYSTQSRRNVRYFEIYKN